MKEVKELLGFKNKKVKVVKVERVMESNEVIQMVTLIGTVKKVKCPICEKYTTSVHDKLKPITIKFNKVAEQNCKLILIKRRF